MLSDWTRTGPTGLGQLRQQMDRLIRSRAAGTGTSAVRATPPSDYFETGDACVIAMDLPGFDRDDLDVAVEDHTLIVRARREAPSGERRYHRRERAPGEFERAFRLPDRADLGGIDARLSDGVLKVRVPKAEPRQGRTVEIGGS